MVKATIIIPNWNGKKFLEVCLPSLSRQTFKKFETIIVDNGSTDDSVSFVKENYPNCSLIIFPENRGFSSAVNAGIEAAQGKYIALLNNDTEVDKNWLLNLINELDQNQEVGFCASKMLFYDDHTKLDGVGDIYLRGGMAVKLGRSEKDVGQYDKPMCVFGACAGAAIYRKKLFADIGLFDEDFFAYLEDVDISFRAQLAGFKCLYVPTAIVYHMGSATTGSRVNETTVYLSAKNYINVLIKNLPTRLWLKNVPWIIYTVVKMALRYIYYGKGFSLLRIYLKGLLAGFKQLPMMKVKRKIIQQKRKVSTAYIWTIIRQGEKMVKQAKRLS